MRHLVTLPNATRVAAAGLLMVTLFAVGCSSQRATSERDSSPPTSSAGTLLGPDPGSLTQDPLRGLGQLQMPLVVGNRWDYVVHFRARLIPNDGSEVIGEWEYPWTSEIVDVMPLNEQEYFLAVEYNPSQVSNPPLPTSALRQDRSGVYSLDLFQLGRASAAAPVNDEGLAARFESALATAAAKSSHPEAFTAAGKRLAGRLVVMSMPGRGAGLPGLPGPTGFPRAYGDGAVRRGSPLPGEISLIVNPLFKGSRWLVRESPRFARVMLRRENTQVPAGNFTAWVMRGFSELYGQRDVVHFWQADEGLIKMTVHAEQEVIGREGGVIGRMITDLDQSLSALTLAEPTL